MGKSGRTYHWQKRSCLVCIYYHKNDTKVPLTVVWVRDLGATDRLCELYKMSSTPSVVVPQCASCIPAGPAGTRWPPGALHFLHPHCVPLVLFRLPEVHSRTTETSVTFLLPGNLVLTVLSLGGSRAAAFQRHTLSILLQMIWQHFVSHNQNIPRQSLVANYV